MEKLSLKDATAATTPRAPGSSQRGPSQSGPQPGPPQLPPQMFTTAAQLLDLTDSTYALCRSSPERMNCGLDYEARL